MKPEIVGVLVGAAVLLAACGEADAPAPEANDVSSVSREAAPAAAATQQAPSARPAEYPEDVYVPDGLTIVSTAAQTPTAYWIQAQAAWKPAELYDLVSEEASALGWTETQNFADPEHGNWRLKYEKGERLVSYTFTDARDGTTGFQMQTGP